jgi:hypothetical protein
MGYTLAALIGVEVKTTRAPTFAKYHHPENAALTWSGRGRKPQWFADHINAVKDPSGLTELGDPARASIAKLRKPVFADTTDCSC